MAMALSVGARMICVRFAPNAFSSAFSCSCAVVYLRRRRRRAGGRKERRGGGERCVCSCAAVCAWAPVPCATYFSLALCTLACNDSSFFALPCAHSTQRKATAQNTTTKPKEGCVLEITSSFACGTIYSAVWVGYVRCQLWH